MPEPRHPLLHYPLSTIHYPLLTIHYFAAHGRHISASTSSMHRSSVSRRLGTRMWRHVSLWLRAWSRSAPLKKKSPPESTRPLARTFTSRDTFAGWLSAVFW